MPAIFGSELEAHGENRQGRRSGGGSVQVGRGRVIWVYGSGRGCHDACADRGAVVDGKFRMGWKLW